MSTVESNRALLASGLATRAQGLGELIISNSSAIYENGVFWQTNMSNTQHNLKFAALMATLVRNTTSDARKAAYLRMIVESVERELSVNAIDGIFTGGTTMPPDTAYYQGPWEGAVTLVANDPTATIPLVIDLAWICHQLPAGTISAARRKRWIAACQANCDLLDSWPGEPITSFYINGNYMAQLCSCYALTATVSQPSLAARYWDMYERAYFFMLYPNTVTPGRWINYGLTIDVAGTDYNWDDYEAHLSENHGEVPGPVLNFDWNYSQYTLDILARQIVITRDTRMIRLLNAISNKIAPRIQDETAPTLAWTFNGTGGSRQNNYTNMATAYLPVQSLIREKEFLTTLLTPAKVFSCWDLLIGLDLGPANGQITALGGAAYAMGRMPGGIVAGIANVAVVRYCAEITTVWA
jgi:hypothetical protein